MTDFRIPYHYTPPPGRPVSTPPGEHKNGVDGAPKRYQSDKWYAGRKSETFKRNMSRAAKRAAARAYLKAEAECRRRNKTETGGTWMTIRTFVKLTGRSEGGASHIFSQEKWKVEQPAGRFRIALVPHEDIARYTLAAAVVEDHRRRIAAREGAMQELATISQKNGMHRPLTLTEKVAEMPAPPVPAKPALWMRIFGAGWLW